MIPSFVSKRLYSTGSLESRGEGTCFSLENRLSDTVVTGLSALRINDADIPLTNVMLEVGAGRAVCATEITPSNPLRFPLRETVRIRVGSQDLDKGRHRISVGIRTDPFGAIDVEVEDAVRETPPEAGRRMPRDPDNDYTPQIVRARQRFVEETSGQALAHAGRFSFEPQDVRGNVENFVGVAQVPIGLAGPLRVNGEHAEGEFVIPLATTEGTLVASYSRGMKVLNLAGGVLCTISGDCMQRAPVFVFPSAREARRFRDWIYGNLDGIRIAAESTSRVARLLDIETYLSNNMAFLRFNFSTGDAAGQNMVGKATLAACGWILARVDHVVQFFLEGNFATDKKGSRINVLRTRGKRVTAEATIPAELIRSHLETDPATLDRQGRITTLGAFLAGANNNGAHAANGIAALFIATGQDAANVAESSAGILHTELTPSRDLYISLTLPSLIVATHGGGTGLPTQRECLGMLGCRGPGKVLKFTEIVAAVALAGEISLGAAIASLDWVAAHEALGRHR